MGASAWPYHITQPREDSRIVVYEPGSTYGVSDAV